MIRRLLNLSRLNRLRFLLHRPVHFQSWNSVVATSRLTIAVLCVLSATTATVHAQASVPTFPVGQALKAMVTHDGVGTNGYRLYVDGVKSGPDLPATSLQAGTVTIQLPALPAGRHTIDVAAFNDAGESAKATAPVFIGPPSAPGPLRFSIVTTADVLVEPLADGTLQVRLERTETVIKP